jgi:hypothetical protein
MRVVVLLAPDVGCCRCSPSVTSSGASHRAWCATMVNPIERKVKMKRMGTEEAAPFRAMYPQLDTSMHRRTNHVRGPSLSWYPSP